MGAGVLNCLGIPFQFETPVSSVGQARIRATEFGFSCSSKAMGTIAVLLKISP